MDVSSVPVKETLGATGVATGVQEVVILRTLNLFHAVDYCCCYLIIIMIVMTLLNIVIIIIILSLFVICPCHTAAILSWVTKRALFYHAKPRSGNHGGEAWRGKTKLFWSPGTIWPPRDKGE